MQPTEGNQPMRTWLSLFAAVVVLSAPAAAQRGMGLIKMNEPFPDLALPSMRDGKPMSIGDFAGKKVVLHVFASW